MSARASQLRAPRTRVENPGLRLVRRRSRRLIRRGRSTSLAPAVILGSIGVAVIVIAVLLEQVVLAQSAFRLAKVREKVVAAEAEHQELLLEATRLGSPARIEEFATNDLGMIKAPPEDAEYIVARVRGVTDGSLIARARTLAPVDTTDAGGVAAGVAP